MKLRRVSLVHRLLADAQGQTLYLAAVGMLAFVGISGLAIDVGHAYYARQQLQESTNTAALAGATILPDTDAAAANATTYSALTGQKNANSNLQNATIATSFACVAKVTSLGIPCVTSTGSTSGNFNTVIVTQKAQVPTFFGRIFLVPKLNVSATSTAAMATPSPYNIALLVDTTLSMNNTDDNCGTGVTQMQCALQGIMQLLYYLYPCSPALATCTSSGGVSSQSVDRVAIFAFPNVTVSTTAIDSNCTSPVTSTFANKYGWEYDPAYGGYYSISPENPWTSWPTATGYDYPSATATSYHPSGSTTPNYEVSLGLSAGDANGFFSDYRTADQPLLPPLSRTLNTGSLLVKMLGGASNCGGLATPNYDGNYGTWYAGAIYAAQAALTAEKAANPGSTNVMILLGDGQANAQQGNMQSSSQTGGASLTRNGTYPSYIDDCQQAIVASQKASKAGTMVYAVAYGSESTGCGVRGGSSTATDTTLVATGLNASFTLSTLTPCMTMENIASSMSKFFSDYMQTGSGSTCMNTKNTENNNSLKAIFKLIGGGLGSARLIPNGTT
jgi:hypothetical protein